uniref:Uncharacterized protein n=1 Tax=Parascaris univalens TaxID=6257 RepID=A0A915AJ87_PARUN
AASSLRATLSPQSTNSFRSQDTTVWPSSEDGSEQPLLSTVHSRMHLAQRGALREVWC